MSSATIRNNIRRASRSPYRLDAQPMDWLLRRNNRSGTPPATPRPAPRSAARPIMIDLTLLDSDSEDDEPVQTEAAIPVATMEVAAPPAVHNAHESEQRVELEVAREIIYIGSDGDSDDDMFLPEDPIEPPHVPAIDGHVSDHDESDNDDAALLQQQLENEQVAATVAESEAAAANPVPTAQPGDEGNAIVISSDDSDSDDDDEMTDLEDGPVTVEQVAQMQQTFVQRNNADANIFSMPSSSSSASASSSSSSSAGPSTPGNSDGGRLTASQRRERGLRLFTEVRDVDTSDWSRGSTPGSPTPAGSSQPAEENGGGGVSDAEEDDQDASPSSSSTQSSFTARPTAGDAARRRKPTSSADAARRNRSRSSGNTPPPAPWMDTRRQRPTIRWKVELREEDMMGPSGPRRLMMNTVAVEAAAAKRKRDSDDESSTSSSEESSSDEDSSSEESSSEDNDESSSDEEADQEDAPPATKKRRL